MQLLNRNKTKIQYKNYSGTMTLTTDAGGYYTGERTESYSDAKTLHAYVTANRGTAERDMFGTTLDYDNVIYTDLSCDINEYSLLWVEASITTPNDYIVRRVAKSLNHKAIAIKKVR